MDVFPTFNRIKACRYGQMLYNVNDSFIGRSLDLYGEFSEGEVEVFRQAVKPGQCVIEVGANIGAHTVFLAQHVGKNGMVLAYEPQRMVFQALCANMAINNIPNVACFQKAVGTRQDFIKVPQLDHMRENNFGGLGLREFDRGEPVPVVPLDAISLSQCQFIKIDVEGMEEEVLRGAVGLIGRHKPILYVENDRPEKSDNLIRCIDSLGYDMYWHRPFLFNPNNFFGNPNNVFGDIASHNMLCVSKEIGHEIQGFEKVKVPAPAESG